VSTHDLRAIRLLDLGQTDSWRTQAVYHALAETMVADSSDTIIVCHPRSPYVCLGYHQLYDSTLDSAECTRRNLPVFRRRVGGGATYLDGNQVFYQCVFHHTRLPIRLTEVYARLLAAPVATLRRLGLRATVRDINEIEANDRRIAGVGGGRIGEACVVVGNLLVDFDYRMMARVWRVPWESFRELAAAALWERVATLRRLLGPISIEAVRALLLEEFTRTLGRPIEPGTLTQDEADYAHQVAMRLTSAAYLNLHNDIGQVAPMRPLKIAAGVFIRAAEIAVAGYTIRASFRVTDGVIEAARLESDPVHPWAAVEAELPGVPFNVWQRKLETRSLVPVLGSRSLGGCRADAD
jgi:lipoate---protein ligase